MPDDPAAIARLDAAVRTVRRVFGNAKGQATWGDGLPHHPHIRWDMSGSEIERLESRPAKLPASQLDWAEVDYFFSHAGYDYFAEKTLPPAMRYFLPRLAEASVPDYPPFFVEIIGSHFSKVDWLGWHERESSAIREWLASWINVAMRHRPESWARGWGETNYAPINRDLRNLIPLVVQAGLPVSDIQSLARELDEEMVVNLVLIVLTNAADLPDSVRGVLEPWVASETTQHMLLDASAADKPWSAAAEMLFGRDCKYFNPSVEPVEGNV